MMQAPDLNWLTVMENLDQEGFFLPDQKAFTTFMSIYKRSSQVGCEKVLYEQHSKGKKKNKIEYVVCLVHRGDLVLEPITAVFEIE